MTLIVPQKAIDRCPSFNTDDLQVMTDIVNACSSLVEKYCNRSFTLTNYDTLLDGTGHNNLLLDNYPVTQLSRVMFNQTPVLGINNTKSSVSRATFRLDETNLYLTAVDGSTTNNHTITRSSTPLVTDLATAVNAFSSEGWSATAYGIYSNYLVADLWAPQGGVDVRWSTLSYIWHHTIGVPILNVNNAIGELVSPIPFTRGYQNYRCIYSAGFSSIPPEIQQVVAELSAAVYQFRDVNANLLTENFGGYSYQNIAEKSFDNLSIASKYTLNQYRSLRCVKYKAF